MNNDQKDKTLGRESPPIDSATDNDRVAGMTPDPRRPDTGVEQRNIDGSAMYEWQREKNSEDPKERP
jgi:hypothetical protein